LFVLNMCVLMGLPGVVGGDVFAKMLSARDEFAARRGALLAALTRGALALAVALLALCARALLPPLNHPELAIPELARVLLPPALFQIVSIAFLSALLSTGDSVLLTASTILTLDVFRLGDGVSMRRVRLITAGVALAGLALALGFEHLLEAMKFGYTLLTASIVMPVLIPLALGGERRPSDRFALAAMLGGPLAAGLWKGAQSLIPGFPLALDPATIGVALSGAVVLLGIALREAALARPENSRA
jgi:Na+/pantothenate symporter